MSSSTLSNSVNNNNTTLSKKKRKKKKKIVILSYEKPPQVPPNFYERESLLVLNATSSILDNNNTTKNLQQAHDRVLDLVQLKMGPRLYQDLYQSMQQAATTLVPSSSSTASLLTTIPQQYSQYLDYLSIVRHVCLALDRQYVYDVESGEAVLRSTSVGGAASASPPSSTTTFQSNALDLWQVGLHAFSARLKELQLDESLYQAWYTQLWESSWKHTSTESLGELQEVVKVWQELGWKTSILKEKLQPQLVQQLQQEAQQEYSTNNPEAFVEYVYKKWLLVSQHWSTFLPKVWIRSLVEIHLLKVHVEDILEKLTIDNPEHVHRLFLLTGRLQGVHEDVVAAITKYSTTRGQALLEQYNFSSKSIQGLLQLQSTLTALESKLHTSLQLKSIFSVLMAEPQTAEALAKYVDTCFKSTKQTTPPPLDELLRLFCHVSAKDVFEAFYKRDLAKRLLGGRVQNFDTERHFLSLLKSECGAGYTSKMEGMFQDVEWSREQMSRYVKSDTAAVDIDVQVLTTGYWPVNASYTLELPSSLKIPQEHFYEYYKKTYQGRRIAWQYALGQVTVKCKFSKKQYDVVMSLALACVVLCFNDQEKWTLPELQQRVGLEDRAEMERILMTLALGKVKLLQKWDYDAQPGTKPRANVHDKDIFTVNEDFTSALKKIKISTIQKADANKEERIKTMEMISRDRLYLLDAVLVRIMKARKTMVHSELIPLVMEHAKVPVTPTDVKGRIESLMDREYLERDKEDRNRYNYLA